MELEWLHLDPKRTCAPVHPRPPPHPGRCEPVSCFPANPERITPVAEGETADHGLEFATHRVGPRINLYDSSNRGTDPDKASADGYVGLSNSVGLNSGELLTALPVDSLNGAIAFIKDPD